MSHILVIANETVASNQLLEAVRGVYPPRHFRQQPVVPNIVKRLLDRLPTTALIISTAFPIR